MDAVGGEAVVGDEPADGPFAGGDDGRHGPQRRAFPGVQVGGDGRREPGLVAERQVHQDDQAQPVGLGDDDLRDPAGDETVEEDDRAVGQVGEGAGEFRAGRDAGAGPFAGDGVPVDLPAEAGQVQAEAPVVGVAAARRRRVVDTAGHDEVHGAQGHGDDLGVLQSRVLHGHVVQGAVGALRHGAVSGPWGRLVEDHVGHRARS